MTAKIINGKAIAEQLQKTMLGEVRALTAKGCVPGLAVVLVGDDLASITYVKNKQKACEKLGMHSELIHYESTVSEEQLLSEIDALNLRTDIHGILVQLPLPGHIEEKKVIAAISPDKDVDGFHPLNVGKMMTNQEGFIPCTPYGIIVLLKESGIKVAGKHAVVVGRSNIVGKPVGQLLLNEHATVTYCHSRTENLQAYTKQADILICAAGKAALITKDHVKQGAIVIDVGMNKNKEGKLCGDADFASASEAASFLTPVPGGVGPMTITMLMANTIRAASACV